MKRKKDRMGEWIFVKFRAPMLRFYALKEDPKIAVILEIHLCFYRETDFLARFDKPGGRNLTTNSKKKISMKRIEVLICNKKLIAFK